MKSSRLPDECVAFEIKQTGDVVEFAGIVADWRALILVMPWGQDWGWWPDELRPLTPSAVAALELVKR